MIEVADLHFGRGINVVSLLIATAEVGKSLLREFAQNVIDYGLYRAILLNTTLFQARSVVRRVRRHVLQSQADPAHEAWSLKVSYVASFNMIGVAGAIVAQIGITGLSLPNLDATHWTAEAAFVISLVAGCLSVYYACIVQLTLGGLHDQFAVLEWLTSYEIETPAPFEEMPYTMWLARCIISRLDSNEESSVTDTSEDAVSQFRKMPSYNAVMVLSAPAYLLNWALASLIVGIGIYYAMSYTRNLGDLRGSNANLAVLLVFILFTIYGLYDFFFSLLLKKLATTKHARDGMMRLAEKRRLSQSSQDQQEFAEQGLAASANRVNTSGQPATSSVSVQQPSHRSSIESHSAMPVSDVTISALKASIAAQMASVKAHEELLRHLDQGRVSVEGQDD